MDKVKVYHAGTEIIENPVCSQGRERLDFGCGFYVTDIFDQARMWATRKSQERLMPGIINEYILDRKAMLKEARSKIFIEYGDEWLDFVVKCRLGEDIWKDYDYIEGGVADDRVIDTVNLYMQGFIDKERALLNLKYLRPNNQICLINQTLTDKYLKYSGYSSF